MLSYSKESSLLSYANAKHFLLLKKKSCGKADIKRLILKCRNSSSVYSTVLDELQDFSKDRLYKPVNVCPMLFSKDVWDRCMLTQNGRGFTDSAWRSEVIRNLKLVNRAVESEVPSSDSDSWQFRLTDSDSDSGPTPTFNCISYLK